MEAKLVIHTYKNQDSIIYHQQPIIIHRIIRITGKDYDGFSIETSIGRFNLRVSAIIDCCEEIKVASSLPLSEITDLKVEKWCCNTLDVDPVVIKSLIGDDDSFNKNNYISITLYPEDSKEIYLVVNNKHNGYYAHKTVFDYTDTKGVTKTLLDTYI